MSSEVVFLIDDYLRGTPKTDHVAQYSAHCTFIRDGWLSFHQASDIQTSGCESNQVENQVFVLRNGEYRAFVADVEYRPVDATAELGAIRATLFLQTNEKLSS